MGTEEQCSNTVCSTLLVFFQLQALSLDAIENGRHLPRVAIHYAISYSKLQVIALYTEVANPWLASAQQLICVEMENFRLKKPLSPYKCCQAKKDSGASEWWISTLRQPTREQYVVISTQYILNIIVFALIGGQHI